MSVEPLRLSREKKRAFRAGLFPEEIITKDMIREMTFQIECSPGTPNPKEFKVTEGMLFTQVPSFMTPPIEYCDHLLQINEKPIKSKKDLLKTVYQLSKSKKSHFIDIRIRRVISVNRLNDPSHIPPNAAIKQTPQSDAEDMKPCTGYYYLKIILIYFPRSKLGISVKSWQRVVYVESTDSSWGSTTRRFLYLGDAILKVDDTEINSVQSLKTSLHNGLQQNGIITLIVERPCEFPSLSFVKSVMHFAKKKGPSVPDDVQKLCDKQKAMYMHNGFTEPVSIFTGPQKLPSHLILPRCPTKDEEKEEKERKEQKEQRSQKALSVTLTEHVSVSGISGDSVNPMTMKKVPDFQKNGRE